jgi:hypothetical protein
MSIKNPMLDSGYWMLDKARFLKAVLACFYPASSIVVRFYPVSALFFHPGRQ